VLDASDPRHGVRTHQRGLLDPTEVGRRYAPDPPFRQDPGRILAQKMM
jgi:hypothetical protein